MKHILTGILVSLLPLSAALAQSEYDKQARQILDAMSEHYQAIGAYEADFSYSMEIPDQPQADKFEGQIAVKGDKFRLNMGGQEVINDGTTQWTYLEEANEVNIDNYDPEEGDISPTQIYNAYQRGFKYVYVEDETIDGKAYQVVDLIPENKDNQFFKIRLHISQEDKVLKRWKIFEKNGTRYTYDINNFNPEAPVDDELFTFNKRKHRGVEVVDLR
ncbi:MAG: outer membrane lipoprotein carrier protein LolA [Tunicatimonas sp.]